MRGGARLAAFVAAAAAASPVLAAGPAVTRAQLALMPLPKASLGPDAINLPLDRDSGVQTNADAAHDAFGNVSGTDLARIGRITGYDLDYNDAGGGALVSGHGLLEVQTGVELYQDEAAAAKGLAFWRKDTLSATSLHTPGFSIAVSPLTVSGLGPSTFAFVGTIHLKGKRTLYGAEILFKAERLLAAVSVSAAQETETRRLALALAPRLQQRIRDVLAGKVAGPPVPLPGKAKAGPPPNGPELSALALRASDLGQAKVVHQGYRLDSDLNPISEYERQVSPAGAFGFLQEEVALFHTPTEASYTFGILAEGLSSSELMKHALAGEKSSDISSWQATPVPGIRVGDESRVVQARLGFRGGGAGYAAFVLVRIGSTTEFVIVSRLTAARIEPASLKRLAALVAERARQGLKR